ncbi:MAG: TatD family hydrolase [Candidatus Pacebacteria bacterium]|nr:TatD family hydrolase [Candidatus Paceibacterota bacterium]MBP9839648.1 TatD family hydrolase [Candidatus Paceibacterota bacterium]
MPKYIDIHSHVNFQAFDEDRDAVIKRALESDTWVINVGTQIDTSRKAVEMTNEYEEGVYAIIGLHPIHTGASYHDEKELGEGGKEFTSRGEVFSKDDYRTLLQNKKVVAIGECGLDYYRCDKESIEKQKEAFIAQIELANEFNKPLMLHIRNNPQNKTYDAYLDSLELLKKHAKVKGDVHFFAGNLEHAKAFNDFGFTLSFTGVITFTSDYDEIIKNTPLNMIMTETDSPYVTPVPYRGKRNEPSYVREVVKKIAKVKGLEEEEVAQAVIDNAKRVFTL